ncbi:MAG: CRISPR system precrRNA processing endoribonuclease RAMP protein Cas6 [bacterium]
MSWLRHLTYAKLEFTLEATRPLQLPQFKGSTFRGAFGTLFKNLVCVKEDRECSRCILRHECSYDYVFETPNPGQFAWFSSPRLPHPYILEPPMLERERFEPGEALTLHLVLIGRAITMLPYFVFVFDEMGRSGGIGKYRHTGFGRFWLQHVRDALQHGKVIYDGDKKELSGLPLIHSGVDLMEGRAPRNVPFEDAAPPAATGSGPTQPGAKGARAAGKVKVQVKAHPPAGDDGNLKLSLTFLTPTRIKHQGDYLMFRRKRPFPAQVLLQNIYRRAFLMTAAHCYDGALDFELPAFDRIRASEVDLHWQDWERYSNRQRRRHHLGGFVGRLTLEGDLAPWLPLLRAGEILHLGSASSFGLGKWRMTNEE